MKPFNYDLASFNELYTDIGLDQEKLAPNNYVERQPRTLRTSKETKKNLPVHYSLYGLCGRKASVRPLWA